MSSASVSTARSLEPYGQLIRMLLPRATSIDIFDVTGACRWASNDVESPDLESLVAAGWDARTDNAESLLEKLDDGTPVYLFRLRDAAGEPLGLLLVTMRAEGAARPWSLIHSLLRPALECLQRELTTQGSLVSLNEAVAAHDRDLDLLLATTAESVTEDAPNDQDELRWLVQRSVDHLGACVGALVVQDKGIAICRVAKGVPVAQGAELLTRTHRHLMSWAQQQGKTLVVNKVGANGDSPGAPYKILCCPVRQPGAAAATGFFALFRTEDMEDFDHRHTRVVRLLARKAMTVLQVNYDSATGLLVREAFDRQARPLLNGARAAEHCVFYINIDQIHVVNDHFGMHMGDQLIARVAELVRRIPHPRALSARISGDRFAVLLPECELSRGAELARELCDAARRSAGDEADQETPEISLSIGVAAVSHGRNDAAQLTHALAAAEVACKAAKDRGRDRVEIFQDADVSIIRRHTDINVVTQLREALRNGRFELELQPILPLQGGHREPHFEVLLRMQSTEGGVIPPQKFFSAAMRYQLLPAIDRWVVENALKALNKRADFIRRHAAVFTLNLSAASIAQPDFVNFVEDAVKATDLPPNTLCFELTETAALASMSRAQAFMHRMRALGCTFALDDFGTGFSSLSYLKELPVSLLKIDGSFIRDLTSGDTRAQSMVRAIAQLAKTMGMETVAEYVENDDLRRLVAELGVDFGQGYCLGKPQPIADVLKDLPAFEAFARLPARDAERPVSVERDAPPPRGIALGAH